jgi:hypothetical protein
MVGLDKAAKRESDRNNAVAEGEGDMLLADSRDRGLSPRFSPDPSRKSMTGHPANSGPSRQGRVDAEDLCLLALKAAMEVEGHKSAEGYARKLREVLLRQTAGAPTGESVRNLAPTTIEAYRRAASAATRTLPDNFDVLSQVLNEIATDLEHFSEGGHERSERLLRFLTTVHDELLGRRRGIELRRRPASRHRV